MSCTGLASNASYFAKFGLVQPEASHGLNASLSFVCFKFEQQLAMPFLNRVLTQARTLDCSQGQAGQHIPGQSKQALLPQGY